MRWITRDDLPAPVTADQAYHPVGRVKTNAGTEPFSIMARRPGRVTILFPEINNGLFEATPDECERIAYAFIKAAAEARRAGDG